MLKSIPKKVFITGTDTEIGKTYVTAKLLQQLLADGKTAEGIKPLVSGGMTDIEILHQASSQTICKHKRYLSAYEPAIAPHIAAKNLEQQLDMNSIVDFMQATNTADNTLIEGFGGWLAPISETMTMAECVKSANIPVILVVGMRLGCISHSLLTAASINNMNCELVGWIANILPPGMPECENNIKTISSFLGEPLAIY